MKAQLDLDLGKSLRDRGVDRAAAHAGDGWMERAVQDFATFLVQRGEATMEQWRLDWITRGRPAPATHKAYGAVALLAARRGLAVHTGRYVKAQSAKTHGHPVALWRCP